MQMEAVRVFVPESQEHANSVFAVVENTSDGVTLRIHLRSIHDQKVS